MSYGSSAPDPEGRTYRIVLNHQLISGAGDLVATLTFGSTAEETNTDQCVQDFVDLAAGSANFLVVAATKVTPGTQTISPT